MRNGEEAQRKEKIKPNVLSYFSIPVPRSLKFRDVQDITLNE